MHDYVSLPVFLPLARAAKRAGGLRVACSSHLCCRELMLLVFTQSFQLRSRRSRNLYVEDVVIILPYSIRLFDGETPIKSKGRTWK